MLSEPDRTLVIDAIRKAETRTSGEIYCVLARASGGYSVFPIAYASTTALLVPLPLIQLTALPAMAIYIVQLCAFLFVLYCATREHIRYRLIPAATRRDRAHQEALRQFGAHGLQHTELRTGVLIFVSFAERYAEVIADAGINQKVEPQIWRACVDSLIDRIGSGNTAAGLVETIEQSAEILGRHFPPGLINRNELPNAVIEL